MSFIFLKKISSVKTFHCCFLFFFCFSEIAFLVYTKHTWPFFLGFLGELRASLCLELYLGLLEISQIFDKCKKNDKFQPFNSYFISFLPYVCLLREQMKGMKPNVKVGVSNAFPFLPLSLQPSRPKRIKILSMFTFFTKHPITFFFFFSFFNLNFCSRFLHCEFED